MLKYTLEKTCGSKNESLLIAELFAFFPVYLTKFANGQVPYCAKNENKNYLKIPGSM